MYGASTADGIQWQFRSIKKDANDLRTAANNGGDPASALNLGTPKGKSGGVKGTPSSKRTAGGGTRSTASKRQKTSKFVEDDIALEDDDDDDDEIMDFDSLNTPSKLRIKDEANPNPSMLPKSIFGRPARAATSAAADAIKSQSIDLTSDEEVRTPPSMFATALPDMKEIVPSAGAPASSARPDIADDEGADYPNENWAGLPHQTNAHMYSDDLDGEI